MPAPARFQFSIFTFHFLSVFPLAERVVLGGQAVVVYHLRTGLALGGKLVGGVFDHAAIVADALAALVA